MSPGRAQAPAAFAGSGGHGGRRLRVGWADLLFVGLGACALLAGSGPPLETLDPLRPGQVWSSLAPLHPASLPALSGIGLSAFCGPLLVRLPWQIALGLFGLGLLALVGVAWHLERTAATGMDVLPPAIGLAAVCGLALLLHRRAPAGSSSAALRRASEARAIPDETEPPQTLR